MKKIKNRLLKCTIAIVLLSAEIAFASGNAISGQLLVINNMANIDSTSHLPGATPNMFRLTVTDATGVCNTANLAYNGTILVKWYSAGRHSASYCVGAPRQISITPITVLIGGVSTSVYDSTVVTAPNRVPTTTILTAPTPGVVTVGNITYTSSYENMAIIITGNGNPNSATAATGSNWQSLAGVMPVFNSNNGALATTGVFGLVDAVALTAETLMRQYGYTPHTGGLVL